MNPEDLAKLTPEQKRIRIAELCGWTHIQPSRGFETDFGYQRCEPCGVSPSTNDSRNLPDYLNDLNAMHEAEKKVGKCGLYIENLRQLCGSDYLWAGIHATAAQRADAFLLTLG